MPAFGSKRPAGQGEQAVMPDEFAKEPGAHATHEPSAAETLPAGHGGSAQGCKKPPAAEKHGKPMATTPCKSLTIT